MLKIIPSNEVAPPDPLALAGLLGPFLPQPPGVVLLSGETSAGKTVLAYNMAYAIAAGKEFVGLTPTSAHRVLYIDLESPQLVHSTLVHAIGKSDDLGFVLEMPHLLYTAEGRKDLISSIREWNAGVVFVDPLLVAWPCLDENNNAEASEQMRHLKDIARETGTLIVPLWNMGEGYVKEKFRARGATARLDRVDVALNYTEVSDTRRKLTIVKSRYGNMKESITVEFAGDYGFEAVEGVTARPSDTQVIGAYILRLVSKGPKSRQELLTAVRPMGLDDNLVDKALGNLCDKGKLRRTRRGVYALPGSDDPQ